MSADILLRVKEQMLKEPLLPGKGSIVGRAALACGPVQILDVCAGTALAVPLLHAGEAIGVIFIRRREVRPFTERQIELVNTFADQAVIAIDNTRLFEEVQARTRSQ